MGKIVFFSGHFVFANLRVKTKNRAWYASDLLVSIISKLYSLFLTLNMYRQWESMVTNYTMEVFMFVW